MKVGDKEGVDGGLAAPLQGDTAPAHAWIYIDHTYENNCQVVVQRGQLEVKPIFKYSMVTQPNFIPEYPNLPFLRP